MSAVTIRRATLSDLDSLVVLEQEANPHPFSAARIHAELIQPQANILVACVDSQIIGYVNFWIILDELHLMQLLVHPDDRRKKIATKLFWAICRHSLAAKCVYLEVRAQNMIAQIFYEKLGFKSIARRSAYYANEEDALVMRMDL